MRFHLVHDTARKLAAEQCKSAPEGWIVTFQEPTRNLEQNAKMWALLHEVSSQVDWYGEKLSPGEWKEVFTASLKRQKVVKGIDGGFVVCGSSTRKMTKREFSDLIELINAFCAERGVRIGV